MKVGKQSGFGLLETMMGLVVFMILAYVGTKAFHNVIENHKEANQVKALTDAVTETAEKLSAMSVSALTASGSSYITWSQPEKIGMGPYYFRYRTVPSPSISGAADTTVVGLQVETGTFQSGAFNGTRAFATLISPHLASRNGLGQVSTADERKGEATNYALQQQLIKDLTSSVVPDNQKILNSYSCYDRGQCCDFMKRYFADPSLAPKDGLDEKCFYRCALGGGVSIPDWNASCGMNFCTSAPWKTKADCCTAINSGKCPPGSVCANVCIDCVGENGSGCTVQTMKCSDYHFQQFVDCGKGTFCDGTPLPDGIIPGIGDAKSMCADPKCAVTTGDCGQRVATCCDEYWQFLEWKTPPESWQSAAICPMISKKEECCNWKVDLGWWIFECNTDGTIKEGMYKGDNKWYAGNFPAYWQQYCLINKGCPSTYHNPSAPPGAPGWSGPTLDNPWSDPYTHKAPPGDGGGGGGSSGGTTTGGTTTSGGGTSRDPGTRNGHGAGSGGGRE